VFSNIATYFIILTAGTILFQNGIHNIATVQDAADALRPLAGDRSYALFAIGVIGTWLLTIPVLAGACSYILSEVLGREGSINSKWKNWKSFYLVIIISVLIWSLMNLLGIDPIKSLIWTAILYGLTAPVLIAIIIHICNNPKVMWNNTNKRLSNTLGLICLALMAAAAIAMIVTSV
jgi:Mn2+/Fe2+ NRAMP family transporter